MLLSRLVNLLIFGLLYLGRNILALAALD